MNSEISQEIINKAYRAYRAATDRSPLGAAIEAVLPDLQRPLQEQYKAECDRLREVLENIRYAYDNDLFEIPEVDAAIEAQVRDVLNAD